MDFLLQITMFVAILTWDQKRQIAGRMDCCICCHVAEESTEANQTRIKRSNTEYERAPSERRSPSAEGWDRSA